jgi:hypothetical protein
MIAMMHFTTLVVTTIFAAGVAVLFNWLMLRAAFQLMRPATARRVTSVRSELVRGTGDLPRAFAVRQ